MAGSAPLVQGLQTCADLMRHIDSPRMDEGGSPYEFKVEDADRAH